MLPMTTKPRIIQFRRHAGRPKSTSAASASTAVLAPRRRALAAVRAEVEKLKASPPPSTPLADLRQLLWSSIDNDSSRDLDQIEVCIREAGRLRVVLS